MTDRNRSCGAEQVTAAFLLYMCFDDMSADEGADKEATDENSISTHQLLLTSGGIESLL